MFSVVIPLYNKELSIKNTIQSVLKQTFQDFEIVVVIDGTTDKSAKIVEQIEDDRIRLIYQENQGVSAARNKGIKAANYEWIAFLDGDDLWKKNHLNEIVKMMEVFPDENVYVTSFEYTNKRYLFKHQQPSEIFKIDNYFKESLKEYLIHTNNIVVNKQCFSKVGWFNIRLNRGEDSDMWARLAKEYAIIKSREITAVYRVEAENRSDKYFNLYRSRDFNYDFLLSTSEDETTYYKTQIINTLHGFLIRKDFKNFFELKKKHARHISLTSIFKSK